jgi:hypothetical protein
LLSGLLLETLNFERNQEKVEKVDEERLPHKANRTGVPLRIPRPVWTGAIGSSVTRGGPL